MKKIDADDYKLAGFKTKKAALEFLKNNNVTKGKKETLPNFLNRIKGLKGINVKEIFPEDFKNIGFKSKKEALAFIKEKQILSEGQDKNKYLKNLEASYKLYLEKKNEELIEDIIIDEVINKDINVEKNKELIEDDIYDIIIGDKESEKNVTRDDVIKNLNGEINFINGMFKSNDLAGEKDEKEYGERINQINSDIKKILNNEYDQDEINGINEEVLENINKLENIIIHPDLQEPQQDFTKTKTEDDVLNKVKDILGLTKEKENVEACRDTLRDLRKIYENRLIVRQDTITGHFFSDLLLSDSVRCLNRFFYEVINTILDILKKYNQIKINVIVASVENTTMLLSPEINGQVLGSYNPFWFSNETYLASTGRYNDEKYVAQTLRHELSFGDEKTWDFDKIYLQIQRSFSSKDVLYCIIGIHVLTVRQGNLNYKDYTKQLKAFAPCTDQDYHRLTACSPTKDRLCIYQTFYYLYIDGSIIIAKNEKRIKESLEKECDEVKRYIKNGELVNFLIFKSKELNETFYVEFYDDDRIGFMVTKDNVEEIEIRHSLLGKKIFLYSKKHVAPRIMYCDKDFIKDDKKIEKFEKEKKKTYVLSPKELKKIKENIGSVMGYDFETYLNRKGEAIPFCLCLSNGKSFYEKDEKVLITKFCDYLDSIKTEVDMSKTHQKDETKQILIYGFNNSRFDNIFIFLESYRRNPSLKYTVVDSDIKYIRYHNIHIFDISLYYQGSLRDVSESFKLNLEKDIYPYKFPNNNNLDYKGDVPSVNYWNSVEQYNEYVSKYGNTFNMKEYTLKYCMKDSKLVEEIAKCHLKNSHGELNGKFFDLRLKITGAGVGLGYFNQIFQTKKLYGSPEKIYDKERSSYMGGRTEVFRKSFKSTGTNHHLKGYDINSSFPYAMTYDMPYQFTGETTFNEREIKKDELVDYFISIKNRLRRK
ncbi:MAG TPA: hypothetical protein VN703_04070 [Candidatus Sulfopaludibacter sp.]|nr:hypothetical protein [Candidatus Sulfopaludibacter sp.]